MENFIVSARKYRPSTFNAVVGQPTIVQTLKNAIRNNSLAQAFLFTGPRGIGKTTCARILAKTINCLNLREDIEPCNECESCRSFNQLASFNIQELDAASNNSVDDIRVLVDQVRIPPQAGKYKVYIIDEVHMLSTSAFNAFLKTLEEPPAYAKFILATTERHKILPTILSRCQIYDFKRISVTDIAGHLGWVAKQEGITCEEEGLHVIAQKADGALRDALSIFDQIVSFSGKDITYKKVIENLNLLDYEYYFRVMDCVQQYNIAGSLLILDEVLDKGFDGHHFISGLGEHLRNLLLCTDTSITKLLEASESVKARYQQQSQLFSNVWFVQALDLISKADQSYRTATNKRLHLELMLLQLNEMIRLTEEKKKSEPPQAGNETPLPRIETPLPNPHLKGEGVQKGEGAQTSENQQSPISNLQSPIEAPLPNPPLKMEGVQQGERVQTSDNQNSSISNQQSAISNHQSSGSRRRPSLKDLVQSEKAEAVESEDEAELQRPEREILSLSAEEVQKQLEAYAANISKEFPAFSSALLFKPVSVEPDNVISIVFPNKVIVDQDLIRGLKLHLRERLSESYFSIEPHIEENHTTEKVILTPRERYQKLTSQHPGVDDFVKKLGLEYEE
jgi:DNA polymerase III subunit gamma/tau